MRPAAHFSYIECSKIWLKTKQRIRCIRLQWVFIFIIRFRYIMCEHAVWLWHFSWPCCHCLWINWFNSYVVEHIHGTKCRNSYLLQEVWGKKSHCTKSIQCVHFGIFISFSMVCHHIHTNHCYLFIRSSLFYPFFFFDVLGAAANICVNNSYFFARRQCEREKIRGKKTKITHKTIYIESKLRLVFLAIFAIHAWAQLLSKPEINVLTRESEKKCPTPKI